MAEDLKTPISMPGAEKAKRDLKEIAEGQRRVGREGKEAGEKAAEGAEKAHGWTGRLGDKVKGLLAGYLGLQGARRMLQYLNEETAKLDQTSRQAAESFRAVLALSELKGERAETQRGVWQLAISSGRRIEEVAPAYYTLLGGTAGMDPQRRQALMQQALLMAKTDPRADLNAIVNLMSTIGMQQPGLSPQQIGNLVSQTIERAKSTPSEMAAYVPAILTTAKTGGVDPATAMAMFAFGTRRGGGVAESGTAIRAAMLGLLAPSLALAQQLGQYGFPAGGDLMGRMAWLRRRGDELPPELVAALGGRRGLEAISGIAAANTENRRT